MAIPKARITPIYNMSQDTLATFCNSVVNKTGDAKYDLLRDQLDLLQTRLTTYNECLVAIDNGNKTDTEVKNQAKQELVIAIVAAGNALTYNAANDPAYILNAGFDLHKTKVDHTGNLNPPIVNGILSTGQQGQVRVDIDRSVFSPGTMQICGEYSLDEGVTWQNGVYSSKSRFLIDGLPNQTIQFRFCVTGTRNRKSLFCPIVVLGVA